MMAPRLIFYADQNSEFYFARNYYRLALICKENVKAHTYHRRIPKDIWKNFFFEVGWGRKRDFVKMCQGRCPKQPRSSHLSAAPLDELWQVLAPNSVFL